MKALLWAAGLGVLVTWSPRPSIPSAKDGSCPGEEDLQRVDIKEWVFPAPYGWKLGLRVFARSEAEAVEVLMHSTVFKP